MATIPEALTLAIQHHQGGRLQAAEQIYRQILQVEPNQADALHLLGLLASQLGKHEIAAECFGRVIQLKPDDAEAHNNLGVALSGQGELAQAGACFRHALRLNPNHVGALNNLGLVFQIQGQFTEAIACHRQALSINPNNAEGHSGLGLAYYELGNLAEATECFRQALAINPNHPDIHNNLGRVYSLQDKLAEACACFRQALRLHPNHADALHNLGKNVALQGQFAEADECFKRVLQIDPNHQAALGNRSLLRLLQGDFANGWRDFPKREVLRSFSQPRWDGSPLMGKTILVFAEHPKRGLGDTIQFVRYLPLVQQRGGTVVLECQPALIKLLTGFPGIDHLVPCGASLPPFELQIPLFHLPAVFGSTLATIPAANSYLAADLDLSRRWQQELESMRGFKIGIVWRGSMWQKGDRRSLPLSQFESLARVEGVVLLSLQVGPGSEQVAAAPFAVTDLGSKFDPDSLDDLAAAMVHLDLVVTEDTSVAHLAGALGRPVWVPLQFFPDWRWLLDRSDSPWYPTMRLFRQNRPGDWGDVFERIAATLRDLIATRTG